MGEQVVEHVQEQACSVRVQLYRWEWLCLPSACGQMIDADMACHAVCVRVCAKCVFLFSAGTSLYSTPGSMLCSYIRLPHSSRGGRFRQALPSWLHSSPPARPRTREGVRQQADRQAASQLQLCQLFSMFFLLWHGCRRDVFPCLPSLICS